MEPLEKFVIWKETEGSLNAILTFEYFVNAGYWYRFKKYIFSREEINMIYNLIDHLFNNKIENVRQQMIEKGTLVNILQDFFLLKQPNR